MKMIFSTVFLGLFAVAAHAETVSVTLDAPGWHIGKRKNGAPMVHNLDAASAHACKGKIVVDYTSSACHEIPPAHAGGKSGKNCPNKCVE